MKTGLCSRVSSEFLVLRGVLGPVMVVWHYKQNSYPLNLLFLCSSVASKNFSSSSQTGFHSKVALINLLEHLSLESCGDDDSAAFKQ